ncbi:MAG: FAD:protein FMN transferase [Lachnospiraceae bacterium]|nr:FAD:protein FMN transferase [Lachnospiraceae bacterium]
MKMNFWKTWKRIAITEFLAIFMTGCALLSKPYTRSGFALDTMVSITLYDTDEKHANEVMDAAFDRLMEYDRLFDPNNPESDIYRMNHAEGKEVTVSDDTMELLRLAAGYAKISDGLLDITIQPLYVLWDFQGSHETLPDETAIKGALATVDHHNIHLTGDRTVMLSHNAQVNPGAIAKGYIADRLKDYLLSQGITSALINLGGNVLTIGHKPDGSDYNIGLQKPFDDMGEMITDVSVSDRSVVTSGIYQRYFSYNDRIYHHILDPETGYPKDTDLNAAVIIADSSVDADAYSTICMLLGKEQAGIFIKEHPEISAILIDRDNHITNIP